MVVVIKHRNIWRSKAAENVHPIDYLDEIVVRIYVVVLQDYLCQQIVSSTGERRVAPASLRYYEKLQSIEPP